MAKSKPAPDLSFLTASAPPAAGSSLFAAGTGATLPPGELPLDRLQNNPFQPADRGNPEAVSELAEVIGRQGFQGTLLARPTPDKPGYYQLAFGHQRRDAAREAGLRSVPVKVAELTDREMAGYIVTENIHRQDLTAWHEAQTYRLMQTMFSMTQEAIAEEAGKSREYVSMRLNLLKAPEDVQAFVAEGGSLRAAINLKQIPDPAERQQLITDYQTGAITVTEIATARQAQPPKARKADPAPAPAPVAAAPAAPVVPPPHPVTSHPVTSHPAAPPVPVPAEDSEARAGRLRLAGLVSSLNRYKQDARRRKDISLAEYTHLCELRSLVEGLLTDYAPVEES